MLEKISTLFKIKELQTPAKKLNNENDHKILILWIISKWLKIIRKYNPETNHWLDDNSINCTMTLLFSAQLRFLNVVRTKDTKVVYGT